MGRIWKKIRSLDDTDAEADSDTSGKDHEPEDENAMLKDVCLCISVGDCDKAPCCIPLLEFANGAASTRADVGRPPRAGSKPPEIYLRVKFCETKSTLAERAKLLPMERCARQHKWYEQLIGLIADAGSLLETHVDKCYGGDSYKFVADIDDLAADVGKEEKGTIAIAALHELFAGIAQKWYKRKS